MISRVVIALLLTLFSANAHAADLRVSLTELASLLNPVLKTTSLRLHNVPSEGIFGGLFDPEQGSFLRFGNTEVPLPLPVSSFPVTGFGNGRYAYYMNDIATKKIDVAPNGSALRLTIRFEDKDAELVGGCFSGTCGFTPALPIVHWRNPRITLDLKPTRLGNSITLTASAVRVNGYFRTVCRSSSFVCPFGRAWAERVVNRLRRDTIPKEILKQLNSDANRQQIAAQLMQYLKLGTTGQVSIVKLSVHKNTVRVSFKLP